MDASAVVIGAEFFEFPVKGDRIPEECVVEVFAPDGPYHPFRESVQRSAYGADFPPYRRAP